MKQNRHSSPAIAPSQSASFGYQSDSDKAFTLTELIVVLAILVVLGGLLYPALAATHGRSNRSVCQYNLRQIAVAVTQYAGDNNDYVFPAWANVYPIQFDLTSIPQSYAKVGFTTNAGSIWACPNRPGFPMITGSQLIIGYQYYGGITNWINAIGDYPSCSPVKLSQSKPHWMLAADVIAQPDGVSWGSTNDESSISGWANLPAHHTADSMFPQGGNEAFCDGSVQWIDIHKMYSFHSWADPSTGRSARILYFYQDLTDAPFWSARLSALYRAGVTSPGAHF